MLTIAACMNRHTSLKFSFHLVFIVKYGLVSTSAAPRDIHTGRLYIFVFQPIHSLGGAPKGILPVEFNVGSRNVTSFKSNQRQNQFPVPTPVFFNPLGIKFSDMLYQRYPPCHTFGDHKRKVNQSFCLQCDQTLETHIGQGLWQSRHWVVLGTQMKQRNMANQGYGCVWHFMAEWAQRLLFGNPKKSESLTEQSCILQD